MRKGWTETTLGEVVEIQMGQSPDGSTYNIEGVGLPFMQGSAEFGEHYPKPEKWCSEPKKIAEIGDLLLSVRAPVGDTNFADQRIAVGRGLSVIRAKSSRSDTKFIRMFIQFSINEMISNSGSGMFSSITGQNLRNFSILLPPLNEQKRIVDLISSLDSYIDVLEQQAESARKSRNAVLHEKLSAGGDGWTKTTLKEVVAFSIGGVWGDEVGQSEFDVAVYRQTEFTDSGVLKTPADAIRSIKKSQLQSRALKYGDILIQKSAGTPTLPGRVVMIEKIPEDTAVFSNFLNLIRADATKCLPQYLFILLWLKHKNGIAFEYQRGTNIRNLDLQNYLHESINLPPLLEQKRIVDLISSMDHGISLTEKLISETKMLRSGLLSNLLSGEHEIPEDYDEVIGAA